MLCDLFARADASGALDRQDDSTPDPAFVGLVDALADSAHPVVGRLRELIEQRGWRGWTRVEKSDP